MHLKKKSQCKLAKWCDLPSCNNYHYKLGPECVAATPSCLLQEQYPCANTFFFLKKKVGSTRIAKMGLFATILVSKKS